MLKTHGYMIEKGKRNDEDKKEEVNKKRQKQMKKKQERNEEEKKEKVGIQNKINKRQIDASERREI